MLLEEGVEAFEKWMQQDGRTNLEVAYWVPTYIILQGQQNMTSLGPISTSMDQAAASQDISGCLKFIEGNVSTKIAAIQQMDCVAARCMMNGDGCMRPIILHILHLPHLQ